MLMKFLCTRLHLPKLPIAGILLATYLGISVLALQAVQSTVTGVLPNAPTPLITPTYDGSGQATEPSIHYFPGAWNGYNYWLVIGPYTNSDAAMENPSILASNDGIHWIVPPGLRDPIALPPTGHLADGDLFYDGGSNQLWVYYIWEGPPNVTQVLRKTSRDGVNWSPARDVLTVPDYYLESPTVARVRQKVQGETWPLPVRSNRDPIQTYEYFMWAVNAGNIGCSAPSTTVEYRTSQNGVIWSAPRTADVSVPGYTIWHIEVIKAGPLPELWMLASAYKNGLNCGHTILFFAKSYDGIHWRSFAKPILTTGPGWDNGDIYRSTGVYDAGQNLIKVWYSARSGGTWHVGFTEGNYTDFMKQLSQ